MIFLVIELWFILKKTPQKNQNHPNVYVHCKNTTSVGLSTVNERQTQKPKGFLSVEGEYCGLKRTKYAFWKSLTQRENLWNRCGEKTSKRVQFIVMDV